jgi:hypothetical protein
LLKIIFVALKIKKPFEYNALEGLHPVYLTLLTVMAMLVYFHVAMHGERQVFWLTCPFSSLPILLKQNSGT